MGRLINTKAVLLLKTAQEANIKLPRVSHDTNLMSTSSEQGFFPALERPAATLLVGLVVRDLRQK